MAQEPEPGGTPVPQTVSAGRFDIGPRRGALPESTADEESDPDAEPTLRQWESSPPPAKKGIKHLRRKIVIGVMSALAAVSVIVPIVSSFIATKMSNDPVTPVTTTSTKPALTIKPLPVRPVVSAFVTTPDQCPPNTPAPPDKPMRICDINKTAVYELQPEALRVQLTNVDSFLNPLTGVQLVQMTMTNESAAEFGKFTAGQVGKQVAFVRGGTVVWGPKISAPIDGQVLQLSGELTAEQAKQIAKMLRDDA